MSGGKGTALGVIAVILGGLGLTLGAYNFLFPPIQIQGSYTYYCSSGSQIQTAIDSIGSGAGIIIITQDIVLDKTINISKGGDYTIQGKGLITIKLGGDFGAFNITRAASCVIKDFKINASAITSPVESGSVIIIEEKNDNPVSIKALEITRGNTNSEGVGIFINSDNVKIADCYFHNLYGGIIIVDTNRSSIVQNTFTHAGSYMVHGSGCKNSLISSNIVNFCYRGIYYIGDGNTIINNEIKNFNELGIFMTGDKNTVMGNTIFNYIDDPDDDVFGILVASSSENSIIGNTIESIVQPATGTGYGVYFSATASYNLCTDNYVNGNDVDYVDDGTFNTIYDNYP